MFLKRKCQLKKGPDDSKEESCMKQHDKTTGDSEAQENNWRGNRRYDFK